MNSQNNLWRNQLFVVSFVASNGLAPQVLEYIEAMMVEIQSTAQYQYKKKLSWCEVPNIKIWQYMYHMGPLHKKI